MMNPCLKQKHIFCIANCNALCYYDVLGKVGRVLFVVYTFRHENTVRLISARIATKAEKRRYEHGDDDFE